MTYSVPQPVITYRHLVSAGTLNASNPLRVVSLCDIDAAYAAFEAKRLGIDPFATPLGVQQWQGLIAISYAARKFGITRHETAEEAKKKCPDIVLVHVATYAEGSETAEYNEDPRPETHKVSLDPYRRESRKVVAIFNEMCPLGAIEKASIDEMYCDLTLAVRQLILQRFPHLARPPAGAPDGLDTPLPPPPMIDWTNLGHRLPTQNDPQPSADPDDQVPAAQPTAAGEEQQSSSQDMLEQAETWTDYALACGAELIYKVRTEIKDRLGYTMSAGIASNKTLAKLSASERKPNGQTTMLPAATPIYLKDLPVSKIRFLGGKLGRAIEAEWQSSTAGDLWNVPLAEMQQKFGEESRWVYDVLRGIDHSAVIERTKNKTMLASKNVTPPIRTTREAQKWLGILSNELCVRLKEAREEMPSLWPSTLTLRYLRRPDHGGSAEARSRQTSFPFVKDLRPQHIFTAGEKLWLEVFGDAEQLDQIVISVALGFSGLEAGEQGQRSLHGFFASGAEKSTASEGPRQAFREAVSSTGNGGHAEPHAAVSTSDVSLIPPVPSATTSATTSAQAVSSSSSGSASPSVTETPRKKRKAKSKGLESLFQRAATAASSPSSQRHVESISIPGTRMEDTVPAQDDDEGARDSSPQEDGGISWTCPSCSTRILPRPPALPGEEGQGDQVSGGDKADEESDAARRLQLARQDHEDFHFALDLETEERGRRAQALMPRGSLPSASQASRSGSTQQNPSTQKRAAQGQSEFPTSASNKKARGLQSFFAKKPPGG